MAMRIERPILTGDTARDLAKIDTWISETCDRLNFFMAEQERQVQELRDLVSLLEDDL